MTSPRPGHSIETQFVKGLVCPLCGRSLTPLALGVVVTFHCKTGHELDVAELLRLATKIIRASVEELLRKWDSELAEFEGAASRAQDGGYTEIATLFSRQIPRLSSRANTLRWELLRQHSASVGCPSTH